MVAITVILAAVIGTFVLNMGEELSDTTPQASVGASDHSDVVGAATDDGNAVGVFELSHSNGKTLADGDYALQVRKGTSGSYTTLYDGTTSTLAFDFEGGENVAVGIASAPSDGFSTGDVIEVQATVTDGNSNAGDTWDGSGTWEYQIIHEPSDGTVATGSIEAS